jgi:hypothetical protein
VPFYSFDTERTSLPSVVSCLIPAVSFPGISKNNSFIRIPHLVFFIGKHFGTGMYRIQYHGVGLFKRFLTGVILSTAFCHLLPDAFGSLQDPAVQRRYHGIGKWTGMIMYVQTPIHFHTGALTQIGSLSALLAIFLVECTFFPLSLSTHHHTQRRLVNNLR